jgi:hypothetical protein
MTLSLNHAFLSNPKGFAQQYPLTLGEPSTDGVRPIKSVRALSFDSTDPSRYAESEYESVASAHRVAFGDIHSGSTQARSAGAQVVDIDYDHAPGRFPLFWLPYKQNRTRKVTLKDKRSPHRIRQTGGEAHTFFTSVLNGCSLFIEGSAAEPSVYHLNAACLRVTQSRFPSQDDNRRDRIGRTVSMEERFTALPLPSGARAMTPLQRQALPGTGVLHGEDYLPNHFLNPVLAQAEKNLTEEYVKTAAGVENISLEELQQNRVEHSALVFGWKSRDTGHWEFWLQTRARVELTTVNGFSSRYVSNGLTKFWPGAYDQMIVRGNNSLDTVVKLLPLQAMMTRRR